MNKISTLTKLHIVEAALLLCAVYIIIKEINTADLKIPPKKSIHGWDRVDEASWESFPNSDPPSSHSIT